MFFKEYAESHVKLSEVRHVSHLLQRCTANVVIVQKRCLVLLYLCTRAVHIGYALQ